jgi:hypothetical protein
MRNILDVMDQMQAAMPPDVAADNKAAFDDVESSVRYSAPEQMRIRWVQLQGVVTSIVGNIPTEDWHFEVLSIWSTLPVAQIRADVERLRAEGLIR